MEENSPAIKYENNPSLFRTEEFSIFPDGKMVKTVKRGFGIFKKIKETKEGKISTSKIEEIFHNLEQSGFFSMNTCYVSKMPYTTLNSRLDSLHVNYNGKEHGVVRFNQEASPEYEKVLKEIQSLLN